MISRCSFLIDMPFVDEGLRQIFEQLGIGRPLARRRRNCSACRRCRCRNAPSRSRFTMTRMAIGWLQDRVRQLEPPAALREGVGSPSLSTDRKCRGTSAPRLYGLPRRLTLQVHRLLGVARRRGRTGTSAAASLRSASMSVAERRRRSAGGRRSTAARGPSRGRPAAPGLMRSDRLGRIEAILQSRWKRRSRDSVRSIGRLFSSRPQLGQKSSLVTKSLGSFAGSFFFVPAAPWP